MLKEDQIRQIEEKMMDVVEQAKEMGVSLRELKKMLEMFYVGRAIVCLEYYNVSMWRGRIRDLH